MPYSASYVFPATSGASLKWSLVSAGVLHATLRNQTAGFYEIGTSGYWEWASSTIPTGFRGAVVLHTNTAAAYSDFNASNVKSVLSVNPGEVEQVERISNSLTDDRIDNLDNLDTPVSGSITNGDGSVAVDHNYGSTDALRYLDADGLAVDNGTIVAYLASDYNASPSRRGSQYEVARQTTTTDGRWPAPMRLDPGSFVLVFYKQGVYPATTVNLTVT